MKNAIQSLVENIKSESENACNAFYGMNEKGITQKLKNILENDYVVSVRKIQEFANAIGKLNVL